MHDRQDEMQRGGSGSVAAPSDELRRLREELSKWRGRVPRLAVALRQRTAELESLKRQVEAQGQPRSVLAPGERLPAGDAGIRLRDERIAELEAKLESLDRCSRSAQGQLHERSLEVADLQADVRAWKQKWQSVTLALDAQARELAETCEERDSLLERNEKLFETTELANRQIQTLADSLAELREKVREGGRGELGASPTEQEVRWLEQQLDQRSRLVLELEARASHHEARAGQLESAKQAIEEALLRAEREARENADHITALDDRLERLKEYLAELEKELAEAQAFRDGGALARSVAAPAGEQEPTHTGMQRAGDDLTRIRGVGPKLAQQLNELGIYRLQQIADLDPETLVDACHGLRAHKGRILKDGWIEQATRLVSH